MKISNKQIKNKNRHYLLKTLIIMIVVFLSSLITSKVSEAIEWWNGNETSGMPTFAISAATGLFPQILSERNFTGGDERDYFPSVLEWRTDISTGTIYCSNSGVILRSGIFDTNKYYAGNSSYSSAEEQAKQNIRMQIGGGKILESIEIIPPSGLDKNKSIVWSNGSYSTAHDAALNVSRNQATKLNELLAGSDKPSVKLSCDVDPIQITFQEYDGDPNLGPCVTVMENNGRGYKLLAGNLEYRNEQNAYILTAMEDVYNDTKQFQKYNLEDIQTAYWLSVDTDGFIARKHLTENGLTLKEKAESYEKFIKQESGKVDESNASLDSSKAQIVVNQETEEYIVGPFIATYPDYQDISYAKALYIKTDEGIQLIYNDNNEDFEIECKTGGTLDKSTTGEGSNGISKTFPKSGEDFYIKFDAKKVNYTSAIHLYMDIEYLAETYIRYNQLWAYAITYQYIGYTEDSGDYECPCGQLLATYTYKEWVCNQVYNPDYIWYDNESNQHIGGNESRWEWQETTVSNVDTGVYVSQPYIQMSDEKKDDTTGQPLTAALDGYRIYKVFTVEASANKKSTTCKTPPIEPIDLTIELGGKVWVDGKTGKESLYDGLLGGSEDTPKEGVTVILHKEDGSVIDTKITDGNGEYLFGELNAMYKYYVEFQYNGQLYEPTIYGYNLALSESQWEKTSKGMDIEGERDAFNEGFKEIGPDSNATLDDTDAKNILSAYTCNGTAEKVLYPYYDVFVEDNFLTDKSEQQKFAEAKIETLYGGGKSVDLMHYVNLGLVIRETSDLALKKDVYTATLEINGKSETYKYNKRENQNSATSSYDSETDTYSSNDIWELKIDNASEYYSTTYDRELYKEDYEYKASSYTANSLNEGFDASSAGITEENELKIYVTYKIDIRNQSGTIDAKIMELVDYYDSEYTLIESSNNIEREQKYRPYIGDSTGGSPSFVVTTSEQQAGPSGYNKTYITGLDGDKLTTGADMYLYITFRVNKENGYNILDEELTSGTKTTGKKNVVEINRYQTYYSEYAIAPNASNGLASGAEFVAGDVAGIVDHDSTPGNATPGDTSTYEDDTDEAPNIFIILNRQNDRTTSGIVWNDERTVTSSNAIVGDGIRQDNEIGVNSVKVQLVELITQKNTDGSVATDTNGNIIYIRDSNNENNPVEYVWKELYSGDTSSQTPIIDIDTANKVTVINGLNSNGNYVSSRLTSNYTVSNDGEYKFISYMPGQYIVRFIYGDGTQSVLGTESTNYTTGKTESNKVTDLINTLDNYTKQSSTDTNGYNGDSENIGLNKDSYNGQDYKSTTYQTGIDNGTGSYEDTETAEYVYDIASSDSRTNISDAKDIKKRRVDEVNSYSNNEGNGVTNSLAEILASGENLPTYNGTAYTASEMAVLLNEFIKNTYMVAESGTINVNLEYNRDGTDDQSTSNIGNGNYTKSGYYSIDNLDFGLEERPKAQLKTTKQVANVKLTLANGTTLFDASKQATNVLWQGHIAHGTDTTNSYEQGSNYQKLQMNIPVVRAVTSNTSNGLIQLSMDEELMHGSTIQITYLITVANIGEVDYDDDQFYYTGKVGNTGTIVKTTPNELIDYVGSQPTDDKATRNNLQFTAADNQDWSVIETEDAVSTDTTPKFLNQHLNDEVSKYTTIIHTTATSKALVPILVDQTNAKEAGNSIKNDVLNSLEEINSTNSMVGVKLVLSQMITSDNSSDDMRYNNMVELVKVSNDVGRRMNYSVVGNQNPNEEPIEIDADDAESVVILPPFGQNYIYYVLGGIVAVILIAGILFVIRISKKK